MNELVNKLQEQAQHRRITREELKKEIFSPYLYSLLDEEARQKITNLQQVFETIGFAVTSLPFGFVVKGSESELRFGIDIIVKGVEHDTHKKGKHAYNIGVYCGRKLAIVSESTSGEISTFIYDFELEKEKRQIEQYLNSLKSDIQFAVTILINEAYNMLSHMIVDDKKRIDVFAYRQLKEQFPSPEQSPVVAIDMGKRKISEYRFFITVLKNQEERGKFLLSLIPQLHDYWKRLNSGWLKPYRKKERETFISFIEQYYNDAIIKQIIQGTEQPKMMLRAYGFLWKEALLTNETYVGTEEFMGRLQKHKERYGIQVVEPEAFTTATRFDESRENPLLFSFSLKKEEKQISTCLETWLSGYNIQEKDFNIVEGRIQLLSFDFSNRRKKQLDKEVQIEGFFPENEKVSEWMDNVKDELERFMVV